MKNVVLTAVVPAPNGCNLKCAGCIIDQRKEADTFGLSSQEYVRFFAETFSLPEVIAFGIQGHEALLPEAWPLARKLLSMSLGQKLITSCVTNGVNLREFRDELLDVTHNIYVSIDSHDPLIHDKSRGKSGAWVKTTDGLRAVRELFGGGESGTREFQEYARVISIFYPHQVARLEGMPALLRSLGIKGWSVSPFISIAKGMFLGKEHEICEDLYRLDRISKEHGIEFLLGDELKHFEKVGNLYEKLAVSKSDGNELIGRLSPDGSYSVGKEIFAPSGKRFWDPKISPTEFVRLAHAEYSS